MLKLLRVIFYFVLILVTPPIALADSTTVVLSFPSPGPSPQDLAWDGNYLWCVDDSTDSLYKLNPSDGAIISAFPTPGPEPRGLTWDGSYLWCSDGDSVKIFKIDPADGTVLSSIPAPISTTSNAPSDQVRGLAWDGEYLYSCFEAGWSSQIVKVDLSDNSTVFFAYTCGFPKGLACDGKYIWNCSDAAGVKLGLVTQYNLSNGLRGNSFDTPGYYPTGLAYDGRYFWLADNDTDTLYQIYLTTTSVEINDDRTQGSIKTFILYQNYPDPFNCMTLITYEIPFNGTVVLEIFNIAGKHIKTLVDGIQQPGRYTIAWDGKNNMGRDVSSGIYFYTIRIGKFTKTKKMLIIR